MKHLLLIISFIFLAQMSYAQCPPSNYIFDSQQKIDDFATNYPACTAIEGNLKIEETTSGNITNLDGLSQLISVGGNLEIFSNVAITNLDGLSQLTSIGGYLRISYNAALTNLDGLFQLTSIDGYLYIKDNAAITNLNGLSQITSVGGYLYIRNNTAITNLDGLSQLTSIGGNLEIINNAAITDLDGLSQLTSIGGYLSIDSNAAITDLDGLSQLTSIGGGLYIRFNAYLTNLDGLSQLTSPGGNIDIFFNTALTDIDGLSQIVSIGGYLRVSYNTALTNLDGLSQITSIGGKIEIYSNSTITNLDGLSQVTSVGGHLFIESNDALTDLDGLSQLTSIGEYLYIVNNAALNDISGIQNINPTTIEYSFGDDLLIYNNPLLSVCEVQSVCDFITLAASDPDLTTDIHNNATGCNSEAEVATSCLTLPLDWVSPLIVEMKDQQTLLRWSVANQVNNAKFVIEHSLDGHVFKGISEIGGEINQSALESFEFIHKQPAPFYNYYRIKQVDLDGAFSYSNIVSIFVKEKNKPISFYPNPAYDKITISNEKVGIIKIYNSLGQKVYQSQAKLKTEELDISQWVKGVYYIKADNGGSWPFVKL